MGAASLDTAKTARYWRSSASDGLKSSAQSIDCPVQCSSISREADPLLQRNPACPRRLFSFGTASANAVVAVSCACCCVPTEYFLCAETDARFFRATAQAPAPAQLSARLQACFSGAARFFPKKRRVVWGKLTGEQTGLAMARPRPAPPERGFGAKPWPCDAPCAPLPAAARSDTSTASDSSH